MHGQQSICIWVTHMYIDGPYAYEQPIYIWLVPILYVYETSPYVYEPKYVNGIEHYN